MPKPVTRVAPVLFVALVGATCTPVDEAADPQPATSPLLSESDLRDVLGPDSIPAIDDPVFIEPEEADWLPPAEPVVVLEVGGEARAYPVQILTWHEIVNDEVAGQPVAVTYCPLCNSAVGFSRVVDGRILDFGVSGKLYNSALVMFDRQTGTYWLHFEGRAVIGELTGTELDVIPMQLLSFGQWRRENPGGLVLSRDTGHERDYGTNPYEGYDSSETPFLFDGEADELLHPMARVVGIEIDGEAIAYPYEIAEDRVSWAGNDRVGGQDLVVFWKIGVVSPLDQAEIVRGHDVGSSGVFVPRAAGRDLTFRAEAQSFFDRETGSEWSLSGRAISGPLAGERLEPIHHLDAFWFAWHAHHPDTQVRA